MPFNHKDSAIEIENTIKAKYIYDDKWKNISPQGCY
jgi:hypothetical protein